MGSIPIRLRHFFHHRLMLRIIQRIVCPVLLLIAGIGSFIYGTGFHREKIITEQEI